ncbi:MAG: hypothetical protein LBL59_06270 [Xanthomonadaceae bacterium]|nr:hypothetical protein [Xanthomonadaceae bacterium]
MRIIDMFFPAYAYSQYPHPLDGIVTADNDRIMSDPRHRNFTLQFDGIDCKTLHHPNENRRNSKGIILLPRYQRTMKIPAFPLPTAAGIASRA